MCAPPLKYLFAQVLDDLYERQNRLGEALMGALASKLSSLVVAQAPFAHEKCVP